MAYAPIWKDTFYTASSQTLIYKIYGGNGYIFQGKAYAMPNGDPIKICVNKICQDYLYQDIDSILAGSSSQSNNGACRTFTLQSEVGNTLASYTFLYCWDYDYNWNNNSATLSIPINGHYAPSQRYMLRTTVNNGSVTTYSTNSEYNKQVCGDYVLHYVNARGGWDSFVFEGACRKADDYTQHYYNRVFDNTTKEFEQGKYISEISTTYTCNSGLLTQAQAAIFAKHLIGTPKCYLEIISENKVIPVIITDTKAEYKTEDGEEVINYEINIKESQTKIRK